MADEKKAEVLTAARLLSGDRPSQLVVGLMAAQALREGEVALFMVDALGRVRLVPAQHVQVLQRPRLLDEDLHVLDEQEAIHALLAQGDDEEAIAAYLQRRDGR